MSEFSEIFEELARHNDRSVIWNNWLDYCIEYNILKLPSASKNIDKNYHGNEEAYYNMMGAWLNELSVKLEEYPYYDLLGEFYEEFVQSKSKNKSLGQVYTPPSVTNLLSELSVKNNTGNICNDPACGSGRTLLAAHSDSKGGMFCIGADLDLTSCHMSVLNFWSHGVRGSISHMDTLENTFYTGWRVNRYLYHGVPIPHIEKINNPNEAYDFIELNRLNNNSDDGVVSLTVNDNVVDEVVEEVTSDYKPKGTGQTTLF